MKTLDQTNPAVAFEIMATGTVCTRGKKALFWVEGLSKGGFLIYLVILDV